MSDHDILAALDDVSFSDVNPHFEVGTRANEINAERQLLLVMLLAEICSKYDATPVTFIRQVIRLYEAKILDSIAFLYDMGLVPRERAINNNDRITEINRLKVLLKNRKPMMLGGLKDASNTIPLSSSRYVQDFEELAPIARGTFGDVYRTRHRLDGVEYAVKKVTFEGRRLESPLARAVLREASNLAQLEHPNCVRYHTAWLESEWVSRGTGIALNAISNGAPSSNEGIGHFLNAKKEKFNFSPSEPLGQSSARDVSRFVSNSGYDTPNSEWSYENNSIDLSRHPNVIHEAYAVDNSVSFSDTGTFLDFEADLSSHVKILDFERIKEDICLKYEIKLYIQMTLCVGQTLRDWLDDRNERVFAMQNFKISEMEPFKFDKELFIFKHIVHGLAHVHSKQIIHRDLKPENIFIDGNHVRIGDFGLSTTVKFSEINDNDNFGDISETLAIVKCSGSEESFHTKGVGTASYASPEQLAGTCYDFRTDLYSLGIILLELFVPFRTGHERAEAFNDIRTNDPPHAPFILHSQNPDIAKLVEKLTMRNPSLRPSTSDLLSAVNNWEPNQNGMSCSRSSNSEVEQLQNELNSKNIRLQEQDAIIEDLKRKLKESDHKILNNIQ